MARGNNPIGFSDLFNFGDDSEITKAIRLTTELRKSYKEFITDVTGAANKGMDTQMASLAAEIKSVADATKSLNVTNEKQQQVLLDNLDVIKKLKDENAALRAAKKSVKDTEDAVANSVNALTQKLKEQVKEFKNVDAASNPQRIKDLGRDIGKTKDEIKRLNEQMRATSSTSKSVQTSYAALDAETKKLIADYKQLENVTDKNNKVARDFERRIKANTDQLKQMDAAIGQNFRNVGNYKSAFSGLSDELLTAGKGFLTVTAVLAGFNKILDTAQQYEALEASIRGVTSSEEEYASTITFLNNIANTYGQSVVVLTSTYKGLAAASKGTSLEGQQTRKIFEGVVAAGTALKLSNETVEGSLLAIQQMMSKGKITAEELNGQLGERLPGAMRLLSEATGFSTAQLNAMMQRGELMATDVLPKLASQFEKTYGDKARANAEGMVNVQNRLSNAWDRFLLTFNNASGISSFWTTFKSGLASALDSLEVFTKSPSFKTFLGITTGANLRLVAQQRIQAQDFSNFQGLSGAERADEIESRRAAMNIGFANRDAARGRDERKKAEYDLKQRVETYKKYVLEHRRLLEEENVNLKRADVERDGIRKVEAEKNKKKGKTDEQLEKERLQQLEEARRKQDDIIRASAKLQITQAELVFSKSSQTMEDELRLENARLKITKHALDARSKLYEGEKKKQLEILEERAEAEKNHLNKVKEIRLKGIEEDTKNQLTSAQVNYERTEKEWTDEIYFEELKLSILEASFARRLELYNTDSDEYKRILAEKATAEANAASKINSIRQSQEKGRAEVMGSSADVVNSVATGEIRLGVARGTISEDEGDTQLYNLRTARLNDEIRAKEIQLSKLKEGDADYYNTAKELNNLHKQLVDERYNYEIATEDKLVEKKKELQQAIFDFSVETAGALFDLGRELNQQNIENLEREKEHELAIAGNNTAARARIEEDFARRQVALRRKQAIFDKLQALFDIGINTAIAVSKSVAAAPLTFGMPFTAFAIAQGAIQAGMVLAKPLPQYFKGRDGGKAEFAEVNEQGMELLVNKEGRVRVAGGGKKTVTFLEENEKVITARKTKTILKAVRDREESDAFLNSLLSGTNVVRNYNQQKEEKFINAMLSSKMSEQVLGELFERAVLNIPHDSLHITERNIRRFTKYKNSIVEQMNSRNSITGNG